MIYSHTGGVWDTPFMLMTRDLSIEYNSVKPSFALLRYIPVSSLFLACLSFCSFLGCSALHVLSIERHLSCRVVEHLSILFNKRNRNIQRCNHG